MIVRAGGATIAHCCVVHGATIGREAMIANGAIVLDGAKIGARTMVAAGALVVGGTEIPDEVVVTGTPAKVMGGGGNWWIVIVERVLGP